LLLKGDTHEYLYYSLTFFDTFQINVFFAHHLNRDCEIDNHAAGTFSKLFYKALLLQKLTVLDAFNGALSELTPAEADKFILLGKPSEDHNRCIELPEVDGDVSNPKPFGTIPKHQKVCNAIKVATVYRSLHKPRMVPYVTVVTGKQGDETLQVTCHKIYSAVSSLRHFLPT
jgi:hypothetical protein